MKLLYYSWWTWTRTIEGICLPIYGYLHIFLWSPGVSKLAWPSSVSRGQWRGLKGRTESNDPIVSWVRSCSSLSPMPPPSLSTDSVTLFSYTVKVKKSLSHVQLFATPWTVARQPPLSMGFSRQEYWSGLPFPSPGDLPDPGIEPRSPALQADALSCEPPGKWSEAESQKNWVTQDNSWPILWDLIALLEKGGVGFPHN